MLSTDDSTDRTSAGLGGGDPVVSGPVTGEPTNTPGEPNQSGWIDEMDASSWPSAVWTQTGAATSPTFLSSGVTAYQWALSSGQRVELLSLLAPTRLDSASGVTRVLARVAAAATQELILGVTNDQADAMGASPTDGAWLRRDASGLCWLRAASGGALTEAALAFALPSFGWCDVALQVSSRDGGRCEVLAWIAGLPCGRLDAPAPSGWVYPRVGAKGAGSLALDRMGRSTVGLPAGDQL